TRPITRIYYAPGFGEWTTADFRDGGVSSSVVSPFMWSLYDRIWQETLPAYLKQIRLLARGREQGEMAVSGPTVWGRVFFGRPYWNVGAVKQCLATLPGFVEREFDTDLGIEVTYEGNGLTVPVTLRGLLRALPTVIAIERGFKQRLRRNEEFRRSFAA